MPTPYTGVVYKCWSPTTIENVIKRPSILCCLFLVNGNLKSQQRFMPKDIVHYDDGITEGTKTHPIDWSLRFLVGVRAISIVRNFLSGVTAHGSPPAKRRAASEAA